LDGVILANPARVVFIATIVRQHLLRMHTLRLSDIERQSKTDALYEFIISERCSLLLARIDERANDLLDQQSKEIRWHQTNWSKQGEAIRAIQKARVDLENQINSIIGTSGTDSAILEGGIA
jgi:predicted AAA+ superfamily ATPase